MVYMICLYALSLLGVNQNDGRDIGFWVCGMTVYGCCIFLANFILALHSKTYDKIYGVALLLGPIAYFLFYWILNLVFIGDISCLFAANFGITVVWYAVAFCLLASYILDKIKEIYENFDSIEDNVWISKSDDDATKPLMQSN